MVAQAYYEVNRLYCRKLNNLIINQIRFAKMKRIFGKTIRGIYSSYFYIRHTRQHLNTIYTCCVKHRLF
jgi:hypothetical protein